MQSNRVRLMLVTLFGLLALGALTAAAAQAVEAPRWSIGGTDLAEGKTHFITAKIYSTNVKIVTANITTSCTELKLKEGSLLGSSAGNAGKNNEVIVIEKCTVSGKVAGKTIEKCKVREPIVTNPLTSELVESEGAKPAEKKGSLLVLYLPPEKTSFATFEFTTEAGGNCPPSGTEVTGKVASQVFTDPNTPPTLGTLVTLESGATEAHSWLLNFPATQPKHVVRIIGGVAKEEANPGLTFFSEPAIVEGTALILLAKREANGELKTEETNWSPLP
jgi:hypothetical protein